MVRCESIEILESLLLKWYRSYLYMLTVHSLTILRADRYGNALTAILSNTPNTICKRSNKFFSTEKVCNKCKQTNQQQQHMKHIQTFTHSSFSLHKSRMIALFIIIRFVYTIGNEHVVCTHSYIYQMKTHLTIAALSDVVCRKRGHGHTHARSCTLFGVAIAAAIDLSQKNVLCCSPLLRYHIDRHCIYCVYVSFVRLSICLFICLLVELQCYMHFAGMLHFQLQRACLFVCLFHWCCFFL